MKVLCVFGKYQYGDPSRGIGVEYAAFIPSLERLGHQVIHFDSWQRNKFADYAELNQALLRMVEQTKPEVMLTVQRDYEIWLETLQIIQHRGDVATISWTTDDSWKYQEVSRFIGSSYHGMSTTYADCVPKYHQDKISNVLLTQWAANSQVLQEPKPASKCTYQVTFVGAAHGERKRKISELKSLGIDVTCFGYGWDVGSVATEDIPRIIRESIISLNFANAYKGPNQVKARTFEVPGAGGFLMTEYADGLERAYILDKEIVAFHSIEELSEKIRYFLDHLQERDSIAQAGFARTQIEHTYDQRIQDLLRFANLSHKQFERQSINTLKVSFDNALVEHRMTSSLNLFKDLIFSICFLIFGREKAACAARKLIFELSWRLFGQKTFTSAGLPGRLFPYQ
jgi:spore maturation protein CgeB